MPSRDLDALRNPQTGNFTEAFATASLHVPMSVTLDKAGLLNVVMSDIPERRRRSVPRDLLERFLAARTPGAVREFASKFGCLRAPVPLGLVGTELQEWLSGPGGGFERQNIPYREERRLDMKTGRLMPLDRVDVSVDREHFVLEKWREPVEWWLFHRERFEQLLAVAAALQEERPPAEALSRITNPTKIEQFLMNHDLLPERLRKRPRTEREMACRVLYSATERLVDSCGLRPRLAWSRRVGGPNGSVLPLKIEFSDHTGPDAISLVGALTVQLLGAFVGTGFAVCSHCGSVFTPSRRPAPNRRCYCERPECKSASVRQAKADYRRRRRARSEEPSVKRSGTST